MAGAVSTSAPLRAKADFFEYLGVVEEALESVVPGCSAVVKQAVAKTQFLTAHRVGWQMIKKKFKLCSNFDGTNQNDVTNLFESLIGNFEGIVQYNKDNRAFEGASWQNVTIETVCGVMTDSQAGSELDRLASVNDLALTMAGETCLEHSYTQQVTALRRQDCQYVGVCGGAGAAGEQLGERRSAGRPPVDLPDLHRVRLVPVHRPAGRPLASHRTCHFLRAGTK